MVDQLDLDNLFPNLLCGHQRTVCSKRVVNARVGHQVGLELVQVHVEGSVKPQGSRDGGDNLGDEPVEVGVGWPLDVEVPPADVIDGLVVDHEGTVRVFQGGVGAQDGVVGFHHRGGNLIEITGLLYYWVGG